MKLELKGPYSLLIDLIMMMGDRGLPDDPQWIAGQLGCSVRMWNKVRKCLLTGDGCPEGKPKIAVKNGIISNSRADKVKIIQRKYRDNQAENARGTSKNKDLAEPSQTYQENQNQTEISLGTDVPKQRAGARAVQVVRFEEFWNAFPHRNGRKENRKGAEEKYRAAVRSGVSEQNLIDAANAYRTDPQVVRGYGRGPVPWLNQRGWEDEAAENPIQRQPEFQQRETYADESRRVLGGGPDALLGDFLDQPNVYQIARAG